MDMSSGSTSSDSMSSSMGMSMMIPYLHFTGGDNLFFATWHPASAGAIAGACVGILFLSVFDRWVSAVRGHLENRWKQRTLATMSNRDVLQVNDACCATEENDFSKPSQEPAAVSPPRSLPPFILSQDLARGFLFAFQAFLHYLLMLAVMTFQAAYFISIVVGLGIGEMAFGRVGVGSSHVH